MVRRTLVAAGLTVLLAGCAEPVFVPEAGPGAPDYTERGTTPPPRVEVVRGSVKKPRPAGGAIDSVVRTDGGFEVTGWAFLDADTPRGVLRVVLPASVDAQVQDATTVARPDVVSATGNNTLVFAGFTLTFRGSLPDGAGVCVLSRSTQGEFELGGSDATLCPD